MRNQKAKGKKFDHCNADKKKKRKWSASNERKGVGDCRVKKGVVCRLVASLFSLGFEFDSEIRTWKGRGGVCM